MDGSAVLDTAAAKAVGGLGSGGFMDGNRANVSNPAALGVLLFGLVTGIVSLLVLLASASLRKFPPSRLSSVFMLSLLFVAVLQHVSSSVVVAELVGSYCYLQHCELLYQVWFASRRCGVLLHLLVALEFFCRKSPYGAKVMHPSLTLPLVLLLNLLCLIFYRVLEASVFLGAFATNLMCLLVMLAVLFQAGEQRVSVKILVTALLAFWGTYVPSFMMECVLASGASVSRSLYVTFLCLTNVRLLMDGYLCWVVCRRRPHDGAETNQQQHLERGHINMDPLSQVKD